jgi:hypothetical protein
VHRGGQNPRWQASNNSLYLPYSVKQDGLLTLQVSIWDEERGGEDSLIGTGKVAVCRAGEVCFLCAASPLAAL